MAAAEFWAETTSTLFAEAPYHEPGDALARILAYVAFRRASIAGDLKEFTCLVGTMAQEVFETAPDIRDACGRSMFGHTATLEDDIEQARREHGITADWSAASLARHTQAVLHGGFVLAKAGNDPALAQESLDHLERYIRHLFNLTEDDSDEQNNPYRMRLRAPSTADRGRKSMMPTRKSDARMPGCDPRHLDL